MMSSAMPETNNTSSCITEQSCQRDPVKAQFQKTSLCKYYEKDTCRNGAACCFAHGESELRSIPNLSKTSICKAWKRGLCPLDGDACHFAHGKYELRTTYMHMLEASTPDDEKAISDSMLQQVEKYAMHHLVETTSRRTSSSDVICGLPQSQSASCSYDEPPLSSYTASDYGSSGKLLLQTARSNIIKTVAEDISRNPTQMVAPPPPMAHRGVDAKDFGVALQIWELVSDACKYTNPGDLLKLDRALLDATPDLYTD